MDHYEPGLDGLRACAVAIVLVYHADFSWARGGFLGISLFFTLSGFLITSILLRMNAATGTVQLRTFWGRRYRRLLPAAYLTLAGIVVFGATVATRQQLSDLPGAVTSAIFQVSNWFFMFAGQSYVNLFSAPSPVQHFWSLSIEEQFYVVMPLVLIVLLRRTRSMRVLAGLFAGGAAASTLLMFVLYQHGASLDRLYYGTDTRAAEILVGCTAAVVLYRRPLRDPSDAMRRVLSVLGVVAFAVMVVGWSRIDLTSPMLWRGGFLFFSLLSLIVILSVLSHAGPVASVLRTKPFAAVGRVSYGLYVFHWPIYLWLDASRTGLAPWPLFGLRVAVTTLATVLSYHLLEMPIRKRQFKLAPAQLRIVAFASIAAIIVGSVAVAQRNPTSNLAGLDTVQARPAVAVEPLRVLLITGSGEDGFAQQFASASRQQAGVVLRTATPFSCSGAARPGAQTMCSNWTAEWKPLVSSFDPDVVIFHVTFWSGTGIAAMCGCTTVDQQTDWTVQALDRGIALLTSRGARILWSQRGVDFKTALRRQEDPFYLAMDRMTRENANIVALQQRDEKPADLISDAETYRRHRAGEAERVLVVGDSVAETLGYGLEQWASGHGAVVWNAAAEGCGIAPDGVIPGATGKPTTISARCRDVWSEWRDEVRSFRPDLVIVLSQLFDLAPRRLAGSSAYLNPGDRAFDDYIVKEYESADAIFASNGAQVVWMQPPCAQISVSALEGLGRGALSLDRIKYFDNVILKRLSAVEPKLKLFDLFAVLCPAGDFVQEIDGVQLRPDGVHFSTAGSMWFADHYGSQLLGFARS